MARKTQMVHHSTDTEHTIEVTCDLCGRKAPDPDNPGDDFWVENDHEVARVSIEMETGFAYPDDYNTETVQYDICPDCFKTKLIPWFAEQGGRLPTVTQS